MADEKSSGGPLATFMNGLPVDRLRDEAGGLVSAMGEKAFETLSGKVGDLTDQLNDFAEGGGVMSKAAKEGAEAAATGSNPVMGAVKGGLSGVKDKVAGAVGGGGGGKSSKANRSVNIQETIDVGVPVHVAYNQWTQFADFADMTRKVEDVTAEDDTKLKWKAKIVWSHRTWTATIVDQVPDQRIIWKSEGQKGHVDGAVTFHEIAPNLTRIIMILEYYPQGFFEKTGNIWRAQGRRARSDLRHFARHVMTRSILEDPEDLEGWRGEIHDAEVERDHEEVVEEEQQGDEPDEGSGADEAGDDGAAEEDYDDGGESEEDLEDEPAPEDDVEEEPEEEPEAEEDFDEEPLPEDDVEEEPEEDFDEEPAPGDDDDEPEAEEDFDEEPLPEDDVEDEPEPEEDLDNEDESEPDEESRPRRRRRRSR